MQAFGHQRKRISSDDVCPSYHDGPPNDVEFSCEQCQVVIEGHRDVALPIVTDVTQVTHVSEVGREISAKEM